MVRIKIRNNFNNDMDDVLNYFEDTYMGRPRRNGHRDNPMFAQEMWNMYSRTRNHLPRTNNNVEGWHRRINNKGGRGQVQLYVLVPLLHTEAKFVSLQAKLVRDGKLERYQRKIFCRQTTVKSTLLDLIQFIRVVASDQLKII